MAKTYPIIKAVSDQIKNATTAASNTAAIVGGNLGDILDKVEEVDLAKVPTTRKVNSKALSADIALDKTDIGLGNVDNTSDANKPVSDATNTLFTNHTNRTDNPHTVTKTQVGLGNVDNTSDVDKPISNAVDTALDLKADLIDGKVPSDQLPVLLALGETSTTAYRGDRGKIAYDHTLLANNPHSVTKTQVGLSNVDDTSDANKPVSTATQTALNLKTDKTTTITAGLGLTGGGDLSSSKTINVVSANDAITVNADNIQLNTIDNLTTTSTTKPLSANQGKVLNEKVVQLETDLNINTEKIKQLFYGSMTFVKHDNSYINNSGVIVSNSSFVSYISDVDACLEGDVYHYIGSSNSNSPGWIFYNNNTIVSIGYTNEATNTTPATTAKITIPAGVNGVKFSAIFAKATINQSVVAIKQSYTDKKIEDINTKVEKVSLINNMMLGEINKTFYTGKYLNTSGNMSRSSAFNSYVSEKISCKEGDEYIYKGKSFGDGASYILYTDNTIISYGQIDGVTKITIPNGVNGIIFGSFDKVAIGPTLNVICYSFFKEYIEYEINNANYITDYLSSKKWYVVGDSEAAGDTVSGTTKDQAYPACIANRTGVALTNNAIGGSQIISGGTYSVLDTYISKIGSDAEYIEVHIGYNDSFDASEADTSTTPTTFKGAFNLLIKGILTNYPKAKMFLIVPYYFDKVSTRVDRAEWLKQRCKFYNVPCLDIVECCGINYNIQAQKTVYFGDVVHLKPIGHMRVSYIVEQFMRGL